MIERDTREKMLQRLGLDSQSDLWRAGWTVSQDHFPGPDLHFIDPAYIREQCQTLQMDNEVAAAVVAGLALFDRQPHLKRLLWYCHYVLFKQPSYTHDGVWHWPLLPQTLDEAAPLFYVYVCLSHLPGILAQHQAWAIPRPISLDTFSDLQLWLKHYYETQGVWGNVGMGWFRYHFSGKLYKLGRLQFELKQNFYDHLMYRHRRTGQVVTLAAEGMRFRPDGFMDGTNEITDPKAWSATLHSTPESVCGYPIQPRGYALKEPITLPFEDWCPILKHGDTVLGVHIPATGPMDFEQCGQSFARALPFFQKHFPDFRINAFTCTSWLLDDQFSQVLKSTSNIVRFLQAWYLLPLGNSSDGEVFERVFGAALDPDWDTFPQRTTLQKAIISHMKRGGHWRGGGGIIIPDDHLHWGDQRYRLGFAEALEIH